MRSKMLGLKQRTAFQLLQLPEDSQCLKVGSVTESLIWISNTSAISFMHCPTSTHLSSSLLSTDILLKPCTASLECLVSRTTCNLPVITSDMLCNPETSSEAPDDCLVFLLQPRNSQALLSLDSLSFLSFVYLQEQSFSKIRYLVLVLLPVLLVLNPSVHLF